MGWLIGGAGEVGVRSAAAEVPSCGESETRQVAGQDSPRGGGGGAERVRWRGAHERKRRSRPGWAR